MSSKILVLVINQERGPVVIMEKTNFIGEVHNGQEFYAKDCAIKVPNEGTKRGTTFISPFHLAHYRAQIDFVSAEVLDYPDEGFPELSKIKQYFES